LSATKLDPAVPAIQSIKNVNSAAEWCGVLVPKKGRQAKVRRPAVARQTFRLYMTFQPAHKALRSNAAGWNVGEGGVEMERSGMT
jgi:hypothetical protein